MKGLTVCQPFAHLIALPASHPEAKPIENRKWWTSHRGPMLIHAGLSREWLDAEDIADYPTMVFGAVVALADVIDCVRVERLSPLLRANKHALGPFCWVLANIQPLPRPIPWRGSQGLWDVDAVLQRDVLAQLAEGRS